MYLKEWRFNLQAKENERGQKRGSHVNIEILEQTRYKNTWLAKRSRPAHAGITLLCIRLSASPWKEEPSFTIVNRTKAKRRTRTARAKEEAGEDERRGPRGLRCWILSTISDRVVSVSLHVRATTLTDAFFSTTSLTSSTTYTGWSRHTRSCGMSKSRHENDTPRKFYILSQFTRNVQNNCNDINLNN